MVTGALVRRKAASTASAARTCPAPTEADRIRIRIFRWSFSYKSSHTRLQWRAMARGGGFRLLTWLGARGITALGGVTVLTLVTAIAVRFLGLHRKKHMDLCLHGSVLGGLAAST